MPSSYQSIKATVLILVGLPSFLILSVDFAIPGGTNILTETLFGIFGIITVIGFGYLFYIHKDDYKECPKCDLPRRMHFPSSMFALRFHECTLTEEQI